MIKENFQHKQQGGLPKSVMIFGCGYVGTALAKILLSEGVRVGALTRNGTKASQLRELGIHEVIEADLADEAWHKQLAETYESVVNCVSSAGGGIDGYRHSYLEGQRCILNWAKTQKIRSFLFTSSTSVYPQGNHATVDETADTDGAAETGQVLLEAERLLADSSEQWERWYILRLAGIYGPGRHYLLDLLRAGTETIPGRGDYTLNLIHRDDIVSAICATLSVSHPKESGIYNLADNHPEAKETILHWLAAELGIECPQFDPQHISPRLQRRGGLMPSRNILNEKAKSTLAWLPQYPSFREGYHDILNQ
jgi:nucleoside-diphosphate-sugar epimerase